MTEVDLFSIHSKLLFIFKSICNCIGGVMVSPDQTKDYKIGICCFSTKQAALRRKNKDWLAWNQDNVSKWGDMPTRRLLFQWASTIKIQLSVLV